MPCACSARTGSSTDLCSVASVTRCGLAPRCAASRAVPVIARLFDSVAPDVKMMSSGAAPISEATCAREVSTS